MRLHRNLLIAFFASSCTFIACGGDGKGNPDTDTTVDAGNDTTVETDGAADADDSDTLVDTGRDALTDTETDTEGDAQLDDTIGDDSGADVEPDVPVGPDPADCDPLVPAACSLPWPSNLYLEPDESRVTGYTLAFGDTTLPSNRLNAHISPEEYRRMDGFGLGAPLITHFPNIDLTGMPGEYDLAGSVLEDASIFWLEVDDEGNVVQHVPYWVEVDSTATNVDEQSFFVRPAVILEEDTRYVVGFRNLVDTDGTLFEASEAFVALRDGNAEADALLAPRVDRFEEVFTILETAGMQRSELQLAWDFHTASSDAIHGAMLHMRDEALELVGDDGPTLNITEVDEFAPEDDDQVALEMRGTIAIPHYMAEERRNASVVGWRMNIGADGFPEPVADPYECPFIIRIPRAAIDGEERPQGLVIYGHGLLGTGEQVRGGMNRRIGNDHDLIFYATDMIGMSSEDVVNVVALISDLTEFHWMSDRLHQGLLNHLLLSRAVERQLATHPEITSRNIVIDPEDSYYSGISQGGIFGASFMALSTDITRGHLGVPGNNYSMLLYRSVDFEGYFELMKANYDSPMDRAIILSTIELLWQQTEPLSYMRHISAEPFAGTPEHAVILAPAKGDYQVHVGTNEIAARSDIGIAVMENYDIERNVELVDETPYPHTGSGVVLYDFGNPWPTPSVNIPPADEFGDPHGRPRAQTYHDEQMVTFFRTGEIIDVCGGDGCTPD